ncbi:MAG: thiamine diphosphokinase [Syntrophaceae bacterium]|nr:thiamine diphosphokinase [Syntrophaceae bacterium]
MAREKSSEPDRKLKEILIVSGGPVADLRLLKQRIDRADPEAIICADGGARHLLELGLVPQVVIGDMDSLPETDQTELMAAGCRILQHSRRKDETDTELALRYALEQKPDAIEIYGALGGRIDHTLANISLLALAARAETRTILVDGKTTLFVVSEKAEIKGITGEIVSLFPLTTEVGGITLEGFEYPLLEATMEVGKPYGVSNRLLGQEGIIFVKRGLLLVVKTGEVEPLSV